MKPLKRCKTKDGANVLFIDLDDDDVIVVDSPEFSHHKRESSEQRENRRVSPQSVIRIEDDDDDDKSESYTNHLQAHREEGFAEFECDATSSHRSSCPYDNPRDARHGSYRFGNDEYEPIEIDSDCEVMEDLSGELRELWERAASQRKVNRQKTNLGPEGLETASGSITRAVRKKNMNEHVSEGTSCSKANAPFASAEIPSTFTAVNEETYVPYDHDTLFPEFDWRNLGVRSSFKNPVSSNTREAFKETSSKMFDEFFSGCSPSLHNVGGVSFSSGGKDLKEQHCGEAQEKNETSFEKVISESQSTHSQNMDQAQCRADTERNASCSHGENFATENAKCDCIFRSDCVCGRRGNFGAEKVQLEEQIPFFTPCKEKSNHHKAGFDSTSGDAANNSYVNMDCEAYCVKNVSKETEKELEKESSSETVVEQHSVSQSKGPLVEDGTKDVPEIGTKYVEGDTKDVPEGGTNYVEGKIGIDIINDKEKLKETEEYKRAMEEEWASRQQQLKLQAEEAQRLRKRKKAESLRVSNMEKRLKQRLEEVRESQKQDSANLNMKEQFRSEVIKELKVLEMRCFDMTSLLRSLGIQVEGSAHPTQQQMHAAYKRAVLKFHPDRTSGSNLRQQVEAEEKFKLISRMKEKYKL